MTKARELLQKAIRSPASLRFEEMVRLAEAFGFRQARQQGSHHIFIRPDVKELVNIQDVHGMAKPYQVRQFLKLVERYNLRLGGRA
jgi:predicted RNA binding protein YcfA (HicA-like mRNA interferase family)